MFVLRILTFSFYEGIRVRDIELLGCAKHQTINSTPIEIADPVFGKAVLNNDLDVEYNSYFMKKATIEN